MKKIIAVLLALTMVFVGSSMTASAAAAPKIEKKITFSGVDGSNFSSVAPANDGGFVIVGETTVLKKVAATTLIPQTDAIIVKYSKGGKLLWKKGFGGAEYDYFSSVTATGDGGFIAVGFSKSADSDMKGLFKGDRDAIIVKYDKNGKLLWKKCFGGKDFDQFQSVISTSDGGFAAVGSSGSVDGDMKGLSKGQYDAIIVKYNKSGQLLWKKSFGGTGYDSFDSVIQLADGGYVIAGESRSNDKDMNGLSKGGSQYTGDAIIVRFDKNGKLLWKNCFGGTHDDFFNSVASASDGGFVAVGYCASGDGDMKGVAKGNYDGAIVKYDKNGKLLSKKRYHYLGSIIPSSDGEFLSFGATNSAFGAGLIIKLNKSLKEQWKVSWGESLSPFFRGGTVLKGGGIVAAGYSIKSKELEDAVALVLKPEAIPISSISLNKTRLNLLAGATQKLSVSFKPSHTNASKKITWSTSNAKVATVSGGTIKAKAAGTATITAKSANGKTAKCQVTVLAPKVISMKINYAKALVNGKLAAIDNVGTKPMIKNGKTLIPMRFAGEKMGASVKWNAKNKTVTLKKGSITLILQIGSSTMSKSVTAKGKTTKTKIKLATAAQLIGGKTMIPLRAVASGLGFDVRYDNATKIIVVCEKKMSKSEYNAHLAKAKAKLK